MTAIGVIGGYGSVGSAAVAQLRAWGLGPILIAGRDAARADAVVDDGEPAALERFCSSLRLVVNCSGSSPGFRQAAVAAAQAQGVPYVDPGGDEPVHELLSGMSLSIPVVLSAGMWPGLTGLLPRRIVAEPHGRLACYMGGRDLFTIAAATDYLSAANSSAGRTFAVWRDGSRVARAGGVSAVEGDIPFFAEPASAVPFLSPEMERLGRGLDLAELVFYTVFPGDHLRATLAAATTDSVDAEAVVRASELDLFGRTRYQRLVCQLHSEPTKPTIVLSGKGSSELTGAAAALTGLAVLEGAVPPGLAFAADVLDPVWASERLLTADAVTGLRVFEAGPARGAPAGSRWADDEAAEEGSL